MPPLNFEDQGFFFMFVAPESVKKQQKTLKNRRVPPLKFHPYLGAENRESLQFWDLGRNKNPQFVKL